MVEVLLFHHAHGLTAGVGIADELADRLVYAGEGDLDAAHQLVDGYDARQLFLYEGSQHLFVDASLPS